MLKRSPACQEDRSHAPAGRAEERLEAVSARASRFVLAVVCLLAGFGVLAFGAVETWARAIILGTTLLLALVWVGDALARGRLRLRRTWLYAPLIVFFCWGGAQLLLDRSLYPHAGREELLWAVGLALVWALVLNALNPPELRRLPIFFAAFGFALALFAIFQGLTAPHDTIYFFRELSQGPTAYGPFVNKNHYAGFMELLAPLPLALVIYGGVRQEQRALLVFMALVMMVSVALSLSRVGAVIVALEVLLLGWLSARHKQVFAPLRRGWLVAGVLPALAGCAAWLGGAPMVERLGSLLRFPTETSLTVRLQVDRDMLAMVRDHPLWGTGLGTFAAVYPRYKSFEDTLLWDHAHNDLFELLAETGIVGAFCLLLFLTGLWSLWKAARGGADSPEERYRRGAIAGIFTGCVGLLLHGLVDFQFHIPATALTFAILYGLGLGLARMARWRPRRA